MDVSYSEARAHLAELWDRVLSDREAIRLTRRSRESVVLVAADEYEGLLETAHLPRSPANARRLLAALEQALAGEDQPKTLGGLRADFDGAQER